MRDLALDHERALKVLDPGLPPTALSRALPAGVAAGRAARGRGVVPIYGAGEAEGRLYIAMRLVRGPGPARDWSTEEGPLEPRPHRDGRCHGRARSRRGTRTRDRSPRRQAGEHPGRALERRRARVSDRFRDQPPRSDHPITSTGQCSARPTTSHRSRSRAPGRPTGRHLRARLRRSSCSPESRRSSPDRRRHASRPPARSPSASVAARPVARRTRRRGDRARDGDRPRSALRERRRARRGPGRGDRGPGGRAGGRRRRFPDDQAAADLTASAAPRAPPYSAPRDAIVVALVPIVGGGGSGTPDASPRRGHDHDRRRRRRDRCRDP